jgi:NTP pyrophosphatase (non-canonical NTP hydrolase)
MKKDLNTLRKLIKEWADERGLLTTDVQPEKQMLKLVEEVGETARALVYNDKDELKDGIGDCVVCLIVLAEQCGMTIEECTEAAWNEIKDRKGKLEDGLFKKHSDL